jgi:hypothetical protein
VRFRLPDPVLDVPQREYTPGTWSSEADPSRAVLLQVPGVGAFVRCLLPVRLTGGHAITFGVWLGVHPDDLQRAAAVWWEPAYRDLVLEGRLANALPVWGLLAAPAEARVHDEDETPYVVGSPDPLLARVLSEAWPHEDVLAAVPG